jgi:hypothetical protein
MKFKDGTKLGTRFYKQGGSLRIVGVDFICDKACYGVGDDFCTQCYLELDLFFCSIKVGRILG